MAKITFKDNPVTTSGELPSVGSPVPYFDLVSQDLGSIKPADLAGKQVVLNIFPSLDTGVCAASVRKFNELAADLKDTVVVCVSADLPFAQARFCGAEGIENVITGSSFRSTFGKDFGVTMTDGPLAGLLARSVVIVGADGLVTYSELVPEIVQEPNYDAAVAALKPAGGCGCNCDCQD